MSFDTAKSILQREIAALKTTKFKKLVVELFGGEPLLNFGLIREVVEWAKTDLRDEKILFKMPTNGTVLDDEIRGWLRSNREVVDVSLSYDGESMNQLSRSSEGVDLSFFASTWPKNPVSALYAPYSVQRLSDAVGYFIRSGVLFHIGPAEGEKWRAEDLQALDRQLDICENVINDYAETVRSGVTPFDPFGFYVNSGSSVDQFCEDRHSCSFYDVTGERYFCHMFSPAAIGAANAEKCKSTYADLRSVNVDGQCRICPLRAYCKPCFGWRFKLSGSITSPTEKVYSCGITKLLCYRSARRYLHEFQKEECARLVEGDDVVRAKKALSYVSEYEGDVT